MERQQPENSSHFADNQAVNLEYLVNLEVSVKMEAGHPVMEKGRNALPMEVVLHALMEICHFVRMVVSQPNQQNQAGNHIMDHIPQSVI